MARTSIKVNPKVAIEKLNKLLVEIDELLQKKHSEGRSKSLELDTKIENFARAIFNDSVDKIKSYEGIFLGFVGLEQSAADMQEEYLNHLLKMKRHLLAWKDELELHVMSCAQSMGNDHKKQIANTILVNNSNVNLNKASSSKPVRQSALVHSLKIYFWPILSGVIIFVLGQLIVLFFSSPAPMLYLSSDSCYKYAYFDSSMDWSLSLRNVGEVPGYTTLCYFSDDFVFSKDGGPYEHTSCFSPIMLGAKQTDMVYYPRIQFQLDKNTRSLENVSLIVNLSCTQKIWMLFTKPCNSITLSCNYVKGTQNYELVSK